MNPYLRQLQAGLHHIGFQPLQGVTGLIKTIEKSTTFKGVQNVFERPNFRFNLFHLRLRPISQID